MFDFCYFIDNKQHFFFQKIFFGVFFLDSIPQVFTAERKIETLIFLHIWKKLKNIFSSRKMASKFNMAAILDYLLEIITNLIV
jgi:hypothetical protein